MRGNQRVSVGSLVGLVFVASLFGFAGVLAGVPSEQGLTPGGASGASSSPDILQTGGSINYRFDDFFNVPYGEWWDYRFASYGDLPINSDCFNAKR